MLTADDHRRVNEKSHPRKEARIRGDGRADGFPHGRDARHYRAINCAYVCTSITDERSMHSVS